MPDPVFSKSDAEQAAKKIGISFDKFSVETLLRGMNHEHEHAEVTHDDPVKTAHIAYDHLKEDPDYYEKLEKIEKRNAKQFPQFFYARHMQPGLAQYEDETVLVDFDAIKKMAQTFEGRPVYIQHQKVDLKNLKAEADGYVTDSFYNELDGWYWVKFMAIEDAVYRAISNKWAVSNAYRPTEVSSQGGTKNNVPYDREILNGEFTHLAIVPDPRYEDACIYTPDEFKSYQAKKKSEFDELKNSKTESTEGKTMPLKFWKNKREEVSDIDLDTQVELRNGKSAKIGDMINAMEEAEKKKEEDEKKNKEKKNSDHTVKVNGLDMSVADLVNAYEKMCAKNSDDKDKDDKENESEDEDDKDKKDKENKTKKNESDEDEDDKEKKNSKSDDDADDHFEEIMNASQTGAPGVMRIDTNYQKLERGKNKYGSATQSKKS